MTTSSQKIRFSFDIGSSSIGWSVLSLSESGRVNGIINAGVNLHPDGRDAKSRKSLAAGRTSVKQARRQGKRRKERIRLVSAELHRLGLIPDRGFKGSDICPYESRANAVMNKVSSFELGRALRSLSDHRGFKNSRKDGQGTKESGAVRKAFESLKAKMAETNFLTYGQWLHNHLKKGNSVRIRGDAINSKMSYEFYPMREMIEEEFQLIRATQEPHFPNITPEDWDELYERIFFQRPLRPVDPGRCGMFPDEDRMPKKHPLTQEFIVLSRLANVRVRTDMGNRRLTGKERDALAERLMRGEEVSAKAAAKILGVSAEHDLNFADNGSKKGKDGPLISCSLTRGLTGNSKKPGPLPEWASMFPDDRELLLYILSDDADDEEVSCRLEEAFPFLAGRTEALLWHNFPEGYASLGETAMRAAVKVMRDDDLNAEWVLDWSDSVRIASERGDFGDEKRSHHDFRTEATAIDNLPYYGALSAVQGHISRGSNEESDVDVIRYGRFQNPTVHVTLNRLRKLTNAMLAEYGKPYDIVVESTRDLVLSADGLNKLRNEQQSGKERNDKIREKLAGMGERPSARNVEMYKLWLEQRVGVQSLCPYSGEVITESSIFSGKWEVDHIIPFSESFDDGMNNKVLCSRAANQKKGKRAPAEAFSSEELAEIRSRILPSDSEPKLWRFEHDAMKKMNENNGFERRMLHATGHAAKVARTYLSALFDKGQEHRVMFVPGRMTAMVRAAVGLYHEETGAKDRGDHRHHAFDAIAVGLIDRRTIEIAQRAARSGQDTKRVFALIEPYEGFAAEAREICRNIVPHHRKDHSTTGRVHEDSVYSKREGDKEDVIRIRKPISSLAETEIGRVADERIRNALTALHEERTNEKWPQRLKRWPDFWSERHLGATVPRRTVLTSQDASARPRKNDDPKTGYIIPGETLFMDIYEERVMKKGEPEIKWIGRTTKLIDANQNLVPYDNHVMRIYKRDVIQIRENGENKLYIVKTIEAPNKVRITELNRSDSKIIKKAADVLRKNGARLMSVDVLGRVKQAKKKGVRL